MVWKKGCFDFRFVYLFFKYVFSIYYVFSGGKDS